MNVLEYSTRRPLCPIDLWVDGEYTFSGRQKMLIVLNWAACFFFGLLLFKHFAIAATIDYEWIVLAAKPLNTFASQEQQTSNHLQANSQTTA